jgi:hypothetical protein
MVKVLRTWLRERGGDSADPLFPNRRGTPLSRDAVERLVAKHAKAATAICPSLTEKHVTPHTLRHSTAMALLHAGVGAGSPFLVHAPSLTVGGDGRPHVRTTLACTDQPSRASASAAFVSRRSTVATTSGTAGPSSAANAWESSSPPPRTAAPAAQRRCQDGVSLDIAGHRDSCAGISPSQRIRSEGLVRCS